MKFKIGDYVRYKSFPPRYGKVIALEKYDYEIAIHFDDDIGCYLDNNLLSLWKKLNYIIDEKYILQFIGSSASWVMTDFCELVDSNQSLNQSDKEEKPCKICQRINDCGVNKCWWCEIESPC